MQHELISVTTLGLVSRHTEGLPG